MRRQRLPESHETNCTGIARATMTARLSATNSRRRRNSLGKFMGRPATSKGRQLRPHEGIRFLLRLGLLRNPGSDRRVKPSPSTRGWDFINERRRPARRDVTWRRGLTIADQRSNFDIHRRAQGYSGRPKCATNKIRSWRVWSKKGRGGTLLCRKQSELRGRSVQVKLSPC